MENKKKWKSFTKLFIQILIYLLVAYYIFDRLSGNWDVFDKIDTFSIPLFLLSILVFSLHAIWNGIVWHYMINSKKYNLSLIGQVDVYIRSYLLRYIPGNVVGILSRAIFNKVHGVPILKSLFAWCYENILYLVIGSILASFILIRAGEGIPIFSNIPAVPFFILISIVGIVFALRIDFFEYLFNKFLVPRLPEKIKRETDILNISIKKRIDVFFGFSFSWIIYSISFLLLVASIDSSLLHTNMLELISINALSWVVGYLSFITPSGSGVREWVMIFSFENFMHIDVEIGIIISLLARIVFILGELLGFGSFFIFKFIFNNVKYRKQKNSLDLSFIIPAYNEGPEIEDFLLELIGVLNSLDRTFEIIVFDGWTKNNSEEVLEKFSKKYDFFKYYILHHPGIAVVDKCNKYIKGFKLAKGKYIFQMDADGQDVPSEIPKFLEKLDEGYDMVTGWKQKRQDSFFYNLTSKIANNLTRKLTGVNVHDMNNGFKGYKKNVAKSLRLQGGYFRFIPLILTKNGYSITEVPVQHRKRSFGEGKFTFFSRLKGLLDLFSLLLVLKMNKTPFYFLSKISITCFLKSFFFFILFLIFYSSYNNFLLSIISLFFSSILLLISFIIFLSGILIEYLRFYRK